MNNKIIGLIFLFLATHAGISFGMNEAVDLECLQLRAHLAIKQGNKSLLMTYPSSEFSNYLIGLEIASIQALENQLASIHAMRDQQEQERKAMIAQGQYNVAQMRQKRDDLQSTLNLRRAALNGIEALRPNNSSEIDSFIAQHKLEMLDLESQIQQIDDILALFV